MQALAARNRMCYKTGMLKQDALRFYKSKMGLARVLGVTRQAIQGWGDTVPLDRALILQDLSKGKLKVKLDLYRRANGQ